MPLPVSDMASNKEENIVHAAQVLGRSKQRKQVFREIYFGKKKIKTVSEIARKTRLPRKRVLEEAVKLLKQNLVNKAHKNGELAYEKDAFMDSCKNRILKIAGKPSEIAKVITKRSKPGNTVQTIKVHKSLFSIKRITIDDIDNFKNIKNIKSIHQSNPIAEKRIKELFKNLFQEQGRFNDWGGEKNDLFTTRLRIKGKRYHAAFAFKGKGTKGTLTPGKMGKNGDQIQRLFHTSADVFMVQYYHQISDSVVEQMTDYAIMKSATTATKILFGIIDGEDTRRILQAYQKG